MSKKGLQRVDLRIGRILQKKKFEVTVPLTVNDNQGIQIEPSEQDYYK